MAIVVQPSNGINGSMGYQNNVLTAVLSSSSELEVGGVTKSHNNLKTWTTFNQWQASTVGAQWVRFSYATPVTADYFGMFGHNMGGVGSVQFQYSTDGGVIWNDAFAALNPALTEVIYKRFTGQMAADWRLLLTSNTFASDPPAVAVVAFGNEFMLPRGFNVGFTRPGVIDNVVSTTNESSGGLFLGRSIVPAPQKVTITQKLVLDAIIQDTWARFHNHALRFPFFFSWDDENHNDQAVYAWTRGKTKLPRYSSPIHESVRLDVNTLRHL